MMSIISWIRGHRVQSERRKGSARYSREIGTFEQLESRELLAFNIFINAGAGLAANSSALVAFERAAQAWETHINDDITVTIDADLANLGSPNVIGQTGSVLLQGGYNTIRNQMVADAADEADDSIVSLLPTAASASFLLPAGFGLNGLLIGSKAALKAVGFSNLDQDFGTSDAEITFNSQFQFDFDNSNGVTSNTMDFETVAIHEIGHALGFISQVDAVDYSSAINSPTNVAPGMLDLFRFENNTANDPSDDSTFASAARSLEPGVDAITDDIGGAGNASAENRMSTGYYTGDGRQASHFKDNLSIGVMDPTLAFGEVVPVSHADLRALDLIGYEISLGPVQNSAPVANNDSATIAKKSGTATGNVLVNDTDANGDGLTATLAVGPSHGTLVLNENGSFVYTPGSTFSGSDSFTYYASDAEDNSNVATVTISKVGGGGGKPGGGGGGKPGGGGGGKPSVVTNLSPAGLGRASASFSLHELPAGMDGDLDITGVGAATSIASADMLQISTATSVPRTELIDRIFGDATQSDGNWSRANDTTKHPPVVSRQQAKSSDQALLRLASDTARRSLERVDRVIQEFADTLSAELGPLLIDCDAEVGV
jgi:VCBS repeat-containing protein